MKAAPATGQQTARGVACLAGRIQRTSTAWIGRTPPSSHGPASVTWPVTPELVGPPIAHSGYEPPGSYVSGKHLEEQRSVPH